MNSLFLNWLTPNATVAPTALRTWFSGTSSREDVDASERCCAQRFDPQLIYWAMQNLPVREARHHLLLLGVIGSGKTMTIRLFLQSIAPRFQPQASRPEQLILFDAKGDMVSQLDALGHSPAAGHVWLLNPFDARSVAWDLSDAICTPAMAMFFAKLIVPEEKNSTAPFFTDAARLLIVATILALNHVAPKRWSLRDLLCTLDSLETISAVTARHPRAQEIAKRILDDDKHAPSVLSTLATKITPFETVAALWHSNKTGRRFSIEAFLAQPGVLILGNDPVLRDSLWPINALLLKALTQEILRRDETPDVRHWFVLDEFRAMQRVDCVHDLLNLGRSKGVSVLLGLQSLEGLIEVYGEHVAQDILAQCAHKTFLRLGGPKSAEWAERFFGKIRRTESVVTESWSKGGHSVSVQKSLHERALFLASYFLDLPLPKSGGDYLAVCDLPSRGCIAILRRPFDEVLSLCQPRSAVPNLVPRPVAEQHLPPWTPDERKFFCGPGVEESPSLPKKPVPKTDDFFLPHRHS